MGKLKRAKRALAMAAVLLLLGTLAGFGVSAQSKQFDYWGWGDPALKQFDLDTYKAAHPAACGDLTMTAYNIPNGESGVMTKLITAWGAKAGLPDLVQQNAPTVIKLASTGVLEPLDDVLRPFMSELPKELLKAVSYKGKIYAFPWRPNTFMLFYRKDIFDKYGIDPNKLGTWDQFIAAGEKLYKDSGGKVNLTYVPSTNGNGQFMEALMLGQKIGFFDSKGNPTIGRDKRMNDVFKLYERMIKTHTAVVRSEWDASWYASLKTGEYACIIAGAWLDTNLKQSAPETSGLWRVMELPGWRAGQHTRGFQQGSPVLSVVSTSPNKAIAKDFIRDTFLNKDNLAKRARWQLDHGQSVTLNAWQGEGDNPLYTADDPFYGGQKFRQLSMEYSKNGYCMPYTKDYATALQILNQEIDKLSAGLIAADQAIKEAAETIDLKIGKSLP